MNTLYLDLETYNDVPINVGTPRYAETVEVMLIGYAWNDAPAHVVDLADHDAPGLFGGFREYLQDADRIVAHNAFFDRTCLNKALGDWLHPHSANRWHCTMARAYAHSLPGSLEHLGAIFKLTALKDKTGQQLVRLFCVPRPKNSTERRATQETHPRQWAQFVDYCRRDVEALRELDRKLPTWNWFKREDALWKLDQKINDRGIHIDLELANAAHTTVEKHKATIRDDAYESLGDVELSQRDAVLAILLKEYGVALPDLQASTLERRIDDENLPEPVRDILRWRLAYARTSNSKWKKLILATNSDERLRGTSQFCGASRTGRTAGRVFQPLNLPRPPKHLKKQIDIGIDFLKMGIADLVFDDPSELASAALRGAVIAPPGKKLCVADFSNIEGRVLAWLAEEDWKLQAYRNFDAGHGHDLYVLAYASSFGVPPERVLADEKAGGTMRLIGKVQELALGYQGAVGAFGTMAKAYGVELTEARTLEIVKAWRKANPNIVKFWYGLEDVFKQVLTTRGMQITFGPLKLQKDGPWTRIILPSGRSLCYPYARLNEEGKIEYHGVNPYTRQWGPIATYAGKLVENVTQAVARDVLMESLPHIEAAGFEIILTVYDEVVAEATTQTSDALCALLTADIDWMPGLPLASKGFETQRYRKD